MEIHEAQALKKYADDLRAKSVLYQQARTKAAKAKVDLDILLAANIGRYRKSKKNLGIEMATLMLLEEEPEAEAIYRTQEEETAKYKSLEQIINALSTTITFHQSLMKYEVKGAGLE